MKSAPLILACVLLPFLLACQASRHRFQFHPSPGEVLVQPDPGGPVIARALISIQRGERRAEDDVPEMVVGLRIENNITEPIELIEEDLLLVDSEVRTFGVARVVEGGGEAIEPTGSRKFELRFPYPEGLGLTARGLTGLNLRFGVRAPSGAYKATASFERILIEPESSSGSSVHFGFFLSN